MNLFGMGGGEIFLILLVALLIWGPDKLMDIAKSMGKVARTLKKASADFTTTVTREIELEKKPAPASPGKPAPPAPAPPATPQSPPGPAGQRDEQ